MEEKVKGMQRITLSLLVGGLVVLVSTMFYNREGALPPQPFLFKIVDHHSGENLLSNGRYLCNDLKVIFMDGNKEKPVDLEFLTTTDNGVVILSPDLARKSLNHQRFYIYFNSVDTDTLDIELEMRQGKRGKFQHLKEVKHNGQSAMRYSGKQMHGPEQFFLIEK